MSAERPGRRTVGIGSMVADRLHRVPRILGSDQKGIMRAGTDGRTAELRVGGVVLNHLGWAAVLGLPVGIFGKQADDANGRFLRDAMDRFGIAKERRPSFPRVTRKSHGAGSGDGDRRANDSCGWR